MKKWKLFRYTDGLVAAGDDIRAKIAKMHDDVKVQMAEIERRTVQMRAAMQTRIAQQSNIEARNERVWAESLARQGITEEDVPLNEWPHVGFSPAPQPYSCGDPHCPVCTPQSGWTPPVTFLSGQVITAAQFNNWTRGVGTPIPSPPNAGNWTIGNPQQEDDVPPPNEKKDN